MNNHRTKKEEKILAVKDPSIDSLMRKGKSSFYSDEETDYIVNYILKLEKIKKTKPI
jgi:hypothetical protein